MGRIEYDDDGTKIVGTMVWDAATNTWVRGVQADSSTALTDAQLRATPVAISDGAGSITVDGTVAVSGTVTVNSELNAALALTDAMANPTTALIGGCNMGWTGAAWSRTSAGGGVEASALRVTIANDSTGVVSVDDNGSTLSIDDGAGSITVDGTVSVSGAVDTELPTAAALASAMANPTTPLVGACLMGFNGTTWDRGVTGNGVATGALRVTVASDSTGVLSVDDNGTTLSIDDGAGSITVDGTVGLSAGVNNIGDVDVLTLPSLPAGTNRIGLVRLVDNVDASLGSVKGTQTNQFVGVQSAKDAGRTSIMFYATGHASGATGTETAITLTKSAGTAATSSAASFAITNGKTFRITSMTFAARGHSTATVQSTTFNFRINTAGAVTTTSTPVLFSCRVTTEAVASKHEYVTMPIPDGFEIVGTSTLQIGVTASANYTTNAPTWDVYITGFEY